MNGDLLKTEGDMNLYIEKLLSNFKSALALIESAKAVKAPQPVEDGTAKPAPAAEAAPETEAAPAAEEAPEADAPKEEPAPEAAPAAEETEEVKEPTAGGNLFDQAAATAKGTEEKAEDPAAQEENKE